MAEFLHVAPVWPAPPVGGQLLFELDLTLRQHGRVVEAFDALGAVFAGHDQLVRAVRRLARLAPDVPALPLEEPDHRDVRIPYGLAPTRNPAGDCGDRIVHGVRPQAARVAVGDQPSGSAARGGA